MKKRVFTGVGTALITPFSGGRIDYTSLERIIDMQIEAEVNALIVGGTTGEAATLSDHERYELYSFAKDKISGRCPLILGTGTNDTAVAIKHTKFAEELGCDGVLLVTPYYNKGTERGIIHHYRKISEETRLPIILYNVPSRTGVNLSQGTLECLGEIENIVGIKEASDSADRLVSISAMSDKLGLYAGNDTQFFTALALGGMGVISVVSNIAPRETVAIYKAFCKGSIDEARDRQIQLLPLIHALFVETNPAPVKHAMHRLGLCSEEMRLPLYEISSENKRLVDIELSRFGM